MEKKLEKKRNKKYNLKKTIEELKKTIEDMEKKKIDLSEIKKLFELVSNISKRLNLTFDNLQMPFKCKICNEVKEKMLCLPSCGHSVCESCLYQNKTKEESKIPQIQRCIECGNDIMNDNIPFNFSLNSFIFLPFRSDWPLEGIISLLFWAFSHLSIPNYQIIFVLYLNEQKYFISLLYFFDFGYPEA